MVKDIQYTTILDTINELSTDKNYSKLIRYIDFEYLLESGYKNKIINEWNDGVYLHDITDEIILENTALALEMTNTFLIYSGLNPSVSFHKLYMIVSEVFIKIKVKIEYYDLVDMVSYIFDDFVHDYLKLGKQI
jgi:hypothetical protein